MTPHQKLGDGFPAVGNTGNATLQALRTGSYDRYFTELSLTNRR